MSLISACIIKNLWCDEFTEGHFLKSKENEKQSKSCFNSICHFFFFWMFRNLEFIMQNFNNNSSSLWTFSYKFFFVFVTGTKNVSHFFTRSNENIHDGLQFGLEVYFLFPLWIDFPHSNKCDEIKMLSFYSLYWCVCLFSVFETSDIKYEKIRFWNCFGNFNCGN